MKWNKANFAGLTSPGQQSEMKSILAGTWPPLKPLPVFKYETVEYRATISFDRQRGEWVCRKTSLPSNEVQELRGGLREITMALPHGEAEIFTEGAEPQEQELEKDANRRLQAIREWREKYENGARYFELRDFLSEGQRTELDDSLRLTLTARQLQFNSKNVANVFDDLSVTGGRFAALIEFAERNKANQGTNPQERREEAVAEAEGAVPEPECAMAEAECASDNDQQSLEISSPEFGDAFNNEDPFVPRQEITERSVGANEFPALTIKNVFPEPDQPPVAERMGHTASPQFEIETSDIAHEELPSPAEPSHVEPSHAEHSDQEGRRSAVFTGFAARVPTGKAFADRTVVSSWRFPRLGISAFQVYVFALLLLFAVTAFTVGLTVGRGSLAKRLREAPQSLLATDAKPPTLPEAAPDAPDDESTSRTLPPPVASSDDSAGAKRLDDATPSEEKFEESTRGSENSAEAHSMDADSSSTTESKPPVKPEVSSERSGAIGPVVRNVSPPTRSKHVRRPKAVRAMRRTPRSPAPYRLTSARAAAPHLTRASTILVTFPDQESQPMRVRFPEKAISATSSFAMTSQLSVLVPPEPGPAVAPKSARLEAGELVSFGWPRYPRPGDRYGLAETIRVRATIGEFGQVQEVRFLGGSASLLPATREAIRLWRYSPTLLDSRPVEAQQDITIEFRPPQYSSRLSTQHPSHN